jgi:hypothetical protein
MTVFRGCFNYGQQGKCLERATAAFLTLPGRLLSTWRQQSRATLGKTTDLDPLRTKPEQEERYVLAVTTTWQQHRVTACALILN